MRDCSLAVCVQSASVALVIGLLTGARIGDQRQGYFVTGYPGPTTRLPDDEGIRGVMHAESRQPSAANHRFHSGYHGASLTRSSVIQGVGMLAVTWAYATRGKSAFWLHAVVRRGHLAVR